MIVRIICNIVGRTVFLIGILNFFYEIRSLLSVGEGGLGKTGSKEKLIELDSPLYFYIYIFLSFVLYYTHIYIYIYIVFQFYYHSKYTYNIFF